MDFFAHQGTPSPLEKGYVSEVDALRALAMTGVVAQHCGLLPFGWMGVWLFFVISGFAITSSLLGSGRVAQSKSVLLRNFYIRRCLRIWPIYFLVVTGSMIAAALASNPDRLESGLWLATFTYNYRAMLHYESWTIVHLWTISVEEQFYLIFPLLFAFLPRRRLVAALWICVALAPALRAALSFWIEPLVWSHVPKFFVVYYFAPAHFDAFSAGALLALFRSAIQSRLGPARAFLAAALGAAVIYGCVYVSIDAEARGSTPAALLNAFGGISAGDGREIVIYTVVVALASAAIALLLAGEGWLIGLCRLPLLRPIGRVSYGAYVYHLTILHWHDYLWSPSEGFASTWTFALCKFTTGLLLTVLIAFVSFRYIEAPVLSLRTRFS